MDWERFFPYESTYEGQTEAIERARAVMSDGGILTMEGACGTGKTITSLTAGSTLIRHPTAHYRRVVVATSVKNQLKQFVTETRAINDALPVYDEPLQGIMLVGKADLHPFLREGVLDELHDSIELSDLRERAVELVKQDSDIPLAIETEMADKEYGRETWYDRQRAEAVQQTVTGQGEAVEIRKDADSDETHTEINTLETAGIATPYPDSPPLVEEVAGGDPEELPDEYRGPFDPFFVGFIAQDGELPFGYSDAPGHIVTKDELLEEAASRGICPHESMALLAATADIVIGNYNHVFDPSTRLLTKGKVGVLDDETILIIDEAHDLEERAREMFSDGLGRQTITIAQNDIRGALQFSAAGQIISLTDDDPDIPPEGQLTVGQQQGREMAQRVLQNHGVEHEHLRVLRDALGWINDTFIDETVRKHLDETYENWEEVLKSREAPTTTNEQFSLEPREDNGKDIETDELSTALRTYLDDRGENTDITADELLGLLPSIGRAVSSIWDGALMDERDDQILYVTNQLSRWVQADSTRYYRELELEYSPSATPGEWHVWDDVYNASLELFNCIPADDLADMIDELGGGIFMSATLEPHDVFQDVSGLGIINEERDRSIETATYEMHFPKDNRASLIAPLPPFIYSNRGRPTVEFDEMTETRHQYASFLRGIANTYGNILIGMPSYEEAQWAYNLLDAVGDIQKELLLDTSSTYEETQTLLEEFWSDDDRHRVLTTSLRGTVTEGVDHAGDKLHTAVVVGVPLSNTQDPRMQAVQEAYGKRFGTDNDFTYAFTIPAVRKARQAIGRVIRNNSDVGVRLLVDRRYAPRHRHSVYQYLATQEQEEFKTVGQPVESINLFWKKHS